MPKASPKKQSIMEYLPGLPLDTKPLKGCSGNRAKMFLKSQLGIKCHSQYNKVIRLLQLSKGKVFYGQEPPSGEVNHNQLQTMASETVDPIDWAHPHPHGQNPLSAMCIVLISATSAGLGHATTACKATTLPMQPLMV